MAVDITNPLKADRRPGGPEEPLTLDICNVGIVLRLVLAAEALLAASTLFQLPTGVSGLSGLSLATEWLVRWGSVSATVLPALLLWLMAACLLTTRRQHFAVRSWRLWSAGTGAICGGLAAIGSQAMAPWLGPESSGAFECLQTAVAALAGAAVAMIVVWGMRLRAQAQAPLRALAKAAELQARIHPHFLFNTLNSAMALIRIQPRMAEQILEDLGDLFRAALADARDVSTLEAELELARRYLALEQVRFADRMAVSWQVDEQLLAARMPALLLQPLVENAVRHGVECSARPVAIRIDVRRQGGQVCVTVDNTLPHDRRPRSDGHGMALANVRSRLDLLHDLEASFQVQQLPGKGEAEGRFIVTLRLPPGKETA